MKNYLRFLKLIVPHIGVFILALICMVFTGLFSASPLGLIVPLVDRVISGKSIVLPEKIQSFTVLSDFVNTVNAMPSLRLLNTLTILVVVFFVFKGIFDFFQSYLMNDVSQRVIRDVKNNIYKKLQELSVDFYSRNPTGKLMSRITYDATIIRDSISSALADTFYQSIQIVFFVAIVVITIYMGVPWKLILISFTLFPLILYPVIRIGKRLRKISTSSQEKIGDINNMLLETISASKLVKAFCMEDYEWNRFKDYNQHFYKLSMKSIRITKLISPMTESIGVLCVAVILWIVGKSIVDGDLSIGVFSTFLAAIFSLMKPVKKLSGVYGTTQQAMAATERIFQLMDEPISIQEQDNPVQFNAFDKNIVIKNVGFEYNKNESILDNINLTINKGEVVALVGPSGAGKSTLVNLIPRFYDPKNGIISIDGTKLKDMEIKSLREKIGLVSQETLLFNDTVKANIMYGHENEDPEQLIRVAKAANAHMFIKDFPQGYDTVIGERGFNISGGQRQRIAIARAVYKNPPILILDEATSQLDTESERLVQDALNNLMNGRTVIVIAHRLSTIKHADKIVVLENGEAINIGTHMELMKKSSLYKRLYEMQFSGQE